MTRSPWFNRTACLIGQGSWERAQPQRKCLLALEKSQGDWPACVRGTQVCGGARIPGQSGQLERGGVDSDETVPVRPRCW